MKKAIYTACFGGYDKIKTPAIITEGWDYVLFTDDREFESTIWKVVYVDPGDLTPVKASKKIKILNHEFMPNYDLTIWHDSSLLINCDLDEFISKYHFDGYTCMEHPARNCIYKEALVLVEAKIENRKVIEEQLLFYIQEKFPPNFGLTANGILIRDKGFGKTTMDFWWDIVNRYSKRDQMAFMYAVWKKPIKYKMIPYNIIFNEFKYQKHENPPV